VTTTLTRGLSPVRTVLDSGAVVIVQETTTTAAVTINATIRAGSVHEPEDRPGLAYLTSRVLDRGTERRTADVLAEELDDRGVALRIVPTRHTTTLSCTCLSEDFDDVLAIVLDVVRHPVFPDVDVEKKRAEVITSLRQDEDNPAVCCMQAFFELAFGATHPYGRRAKGTIERVERITRDEIAAYHRSRFHPAALSLAVVGQVSAQQALTRASAELDGWMGVEAMEPPVPVPAPLTERIERVIPMPGKSQTDIAYGFTSIQRLDPRFYAYWVMNNILGQFGLGGRLADNIRERQGMAYYVSSALDANVIEGPLVIRAGVSPANVDRAVASIDEEIARLVGDGLTAQEVDESRRYLIGSIPRALETNAAIANFLQVEEFFGLGLDYDVRLPDLLTAVSLDDANAAARRVLDPARATLVVAGPYAGTS
jgi:zinc protease